MKWSKQQENNKQGNQKKKIFSNKLRVCFSIKATAWEKVHANQLKTLIIIMR